jgi:salicylate hydroxylase
MDVAIFGAGVSGLAAAIGFKRAGHTVRIYEKNSNNPEAGMGFILLRNGIQQLQAIGVKIDPLAIGIPLINYQLRNPQGDVNKVERLPDGSLGVARNRLITCLQQHLADEDMFFESSVESYNLSSSQPSCIEDVTLSSGKRVKADLYIAADGLRSKARSLMFPQWHNASARVHEIVALAHDPSLVEWAGNMFNKFVSCSGGLAFGMVPVTNEHVVWYMQFDTHTYAIPDFDVERRKQRLWDLVGDWAPEIRQAIQSSNLRRTHVWRPVDTNVLPHFHMNNLALVGDAAHPLLPFTSQGLSAAMEDSCTLLKCIQSMPSIQQGLQDYSFLRVPAVAPFVMQGRAIETSFLKSRSEAYDVLPIAA